MFANQRDELLCGDQKGHRVNETEQAEDDETSQPVGVSAREKFFEKIAHTHEAGETVQRSTSNVQYRM